MQLLYEKIVCMCVLLDKDGHEGLDMFKKHTTMLIVCNVYMYFVKCVQYYLCMKYPDDPVHLPKCAVYN